MTHVDLAVIGSGSGNSLVGPAWQDKSVAMVESGTFGGTCLNVGCIPTKMYVYTADVGRAITTAGRYGIDAHIDAIRWPAIRDRIFGRIDPVSAKGETGRRDAANITLFTGTAAFDGARSLVVSSAAGAERVTASQVVIATGSRPVVPPVVADSGVAFHTSDTVMRIEELPASIVILGGGYIAAEFAHVFSSLGVTVRIVTRGPGLLTAQDQAIGERFTAAARTTWEVQLDAEVRAVRAAGEGVELELADGRRAGAQLLLVATGRRPNSDRLGLELAGVQVGAGDRIRVDEFGRTSAEGVWALGDVSSEFQLKHVANSEARSVAHNLLVANGMSAGVMTSLQHRFVPSAVFTDPQIARVGATEQELRAAGRQFVSATQAFGDTAYGWAMEDRTSICRLYADPATGLLLGAHILGPQASLLIQPLIQAMNFGQPVHELARGQYWIHPALMEVVENALLALDIDARSGAGS